MKRTRVLFYLSTAFLMSCGGATAPEPVELGITQYAPAAGQLVDPAAGIDLAFNGELPESSALPKVRLVGPHGEVAGIFDVDASKRSAHFYPGAPLQPGSHYRVEIDGPKNHAEGGQSPAPVSWEFDTNKLDVTKINQPGPIANTRPQILFNNDGDGILVWELRSGVSSRTALVYALFDHVGKVWSAARILTEDSSRSAVRVAATNSHFLVVWDDINIPMAAVIAGRGDSSPSVSRIFDRRLGDLDVAVGYPSPVPYWPGGLFSAASRGDQFAVAWALVVYDATTQKYVPKIRLSTLMVDPAESLRWEAPLEIASGGAISRVGLTKNDDAYLVSWIAESADDIAVHTKLVDSAARAVGPDQVVFTDSRNRRAATLSFAASRKSFIGVWDHSDGKIHARINENGTWTPDHAIGAGVPVSDSVYGIGSAPLATATADGFLVSWSDADVKAVRLTKDGDGIWQASIEQIVAHLACATTKIASVNQTAERNWITLGQSPRLSETWRTLSENGGFGGGAGGGGGNGFGEYACFDSKPGDIRPVDNVAVFSADAAGGSLSPWSVFASVSGLFVVDTYVASATVDNRMSWAWNTNSTTASNIFVGNFADVAGANSLPTERLLDHAGDVQTAATANGTRLALWSQGELGTQVMRAARFLDGKWGDPFSPIFPTGSFARNERLVEYDGDVYMFNLGYGKNGFVPKKWNGDATFSAVPLPETSLPDGYFTASVVSAGRQGILVLGASVQLTGKLLVALLYRKGTWSVKQWSVGDSARYSIVASDRGFLVEKEVWSAGGSQRQFAQYNVAENGIGVWSELGETSTYEGDIYGRFLAGNSVDYAMVPRRSCYEDTVIEDCPATVRFLTTGVGTAWSAPINLPFRGDSVKGLVGFEGRFFVVTREFKRAASKGKELLQLMRVTEIWREGDLVQVGATATLQTTAGSITSDPVFYADASQIVLGWRTEFSLDGDWTSNVMVTRFANGKWEQAKTADVGAGQVFTVAPLPHDAAVVVWARAHLDSETQQSLYRATAAKVEF